MVLAVIGAVLGNRVTKLLAAVPIAALVAVAVVLLGGSSAAARRAKPDKVHAHASAVARVLRVGTYRRIAGQFSTIQAAVDAASPGDWVLVAPGDYHEQADHRANPGPQPDTTPSGVVISTPGVHLRGMDRNQVIVDGTTPGPGPACSSDPSRQDYGPKASDGSSLGRNGVLVWQANNVTVENLTACNFLTGSGRSGNEIWWNGGDGSGQLGKLSGFYGSYLNATSTFFKDNSTAAAYGIFSSNATDGTWFQTYASNFSDSNYYVGACQQLCNTTLDHVQSEYSALGYSGTNAGGQVIIENSEFDNNKDGFDTNSQNNDDAPSPQDGSCPGGAISPITHTTSCWVFIHNYVHDNNNPNVPGTGVASNGPTGTGISISGARNNTVMYNRFVNNGAWGIILVPYPDTATPPAVAHCQGGINTGQLCLYDDWGNEIAHNTFQGNGFFGNDTNSDFGEITVTAAPTNCFHDNVDSSGTVTSSPANLEASKPRCRETASTPPDPNPSLLNQVACDTQFFASLLPGGSSPCTPGSNYPKATGVVMHPLPSGLATMPNPCAGVPANPWCANGSHARTRRRSHHKTVTIPAGGTRTIKVIYPDALRFRNDRYSGAIRISGAGAKTVKILKRGSVRHGYQYRVTVRNSGRKPARVTVTAITTRR